MNKRDKIGLAGWFCLAIFLNIIAELFMLGREYYQYDKYKETNAFEWDDVKRYSIAIALGSILGFLIFM